MVYSYFVDDQAGAFTSRVEGRKALDEQLLVPIIVDEPTVPGTMTRAEADRQREETLRANWGRDPEAQAQWR